MLDWTLSATIRMLLPRPTDMVLIGCGERWGVVDALPTIISGPRLISS